MKQRQHLLDIRTSGAGLTNVTLAVADHVAVSTIASGVVHIFCRHTSASLLIQENADRDVLYDLTAFFRRLVPDGDPMFRHQSEGPDDMPAHVKSALTQTTLTVPITDGRLALGVWQGIFLFEHRSAPHSRQLLLHAVGE